MKRKFVTTREASFSCGVSTQFLKKNRDIHGGFLEEEVHYWLGANINSSILWDVDEILKTFHERGKIIRRGREAVRNLQKERFEAAKNNLKGSE